MAEMTETPPALGSAVRFLQITPCRQMLFQHLTCSSTLIPLVLLLCIQLERIRIIRLQANLQVLAEFVLNGFLGLGHVTFESILFYPPFS